MANLKEIKIIVKGSDWEEAKEQAYKKANAKFKADGFRVGKAPKDVFMKKYGEDRLNMDAVDISLQKEYVKMLEANKDLPIIAEPDGKLDKIDNDGYEFTFTLTLKPEVKVGKYTKLGVKKETPKATKKEIEDTIHEMQHRFAELVNKDSEIKEGDTVILDFEGFKDEVPFKGGKAENYSLVIGSKTFIPGFEEALIGLKVGNVKDIDLTFPEDYHAEDLKGAKVVFKVKINEVKETVIPEIDKDFFEDLGMEGITDKKSLEVEVEKTILARKEMEAENKYVDDLLKKAAESVTVEIPDVMIEEELHRMIHQYSDSLSMQGITLEQFYQFTNSNEDALKDQMRPEATNRITYRLMLEEIAKLEKIEISDEDADKEALEMAQKYQMDKEEFLKQFGGIETVKYDFKMRQAIEKLKD